MLEQKREQKQQLKHLNKKRNFALNTPCFICNTSDLRSKMTGLTTSLKIYALLSFLINHVTAYDVVPVTDEMRSSAAAIISAFLPTTGVTKSSSSVWQKLAYITDTWGPRFSGSDSLEHVLDYIRDTATAEGLTVTEQQAFLPRWVRGTEYASWTTSTRTKKLHMIGLGMSNTTGGINGGGVEISAPGIVIYGSSPAEAYSNLVANCSLIQGKIVVFNVPFTTYGGTVGVRGSAGNWGAQCGAVAALIRTVGAYSLQNPHTGATDQNAPIAAAAVTIEDAEQMQRMQDRGTPFTITLFMNSTWLPDRPSRNVLIDVLGTENPGEVVAIGGHVDSWDIAEGAMDDGGGFVGSWEAVRMIAALKKQGLVNNKRTIRAVMYVNEENGDRGGDAYAAQLATATYQGLDNHSWIMESDIGAFRPYGIGIACATSLNGGCSAAYAQLSLIGTELLQVIGSGNVSLDGGGTDVDPSCAYGPVCGGLNVLDPRLTNDGNNPCTIDGQWTAPTDWSVNTQYDSQYFWIHHSEADTMERMDPNQLNTVAATLAVWAYSISQLPTLLPQDDSPSSTPSPSNNAPSDSSVALISGAVCGGIVGVLVLGYAALWIKKLADRKAQGGELSESLGRAYRSV